jgi:hypothetical protein
MTTTEHPTTLSWLFPPSHGRSTEDGLHRCLRRALHLDKLEVDVPTLARDVVWIELASLVRQRMATDLVSILSYGWAKSTDLVRAAHRTVASPGTSDVVTLAEHTIRYADIADVDLVIDEAVAVTMHVRVQADLHVMALAFGVEHGRVMNVRGGHADITVRLFVQDAEIAHRTVQIDLDAELSLGNGIPLLPLAAPTTEIPNQAQSQAN